MKNFFLKERNSYILSLLFHALLLVFMMFLTIGGSSTELQYVEIDFGSIGAGAEGSSNFNEAVNRNTEEITEELPQEQIKKDDAKLPITKNEFDEEIIRESEKKNEKKEKQKVERENKSDETNPSISKSPSESFGFGSSGYSFDWGGRGTRKILRWEKPLFPPGVNREVDIKIRFTILPDGSVVSPIPIVKADMQLEDAAISALKTWKFEPLRQGQHQFEQVVIITIPYRLD